MKATATISGMESLATLANVRDEKAHALSFYFSWSSFSDTSHREEVLNIEHLVSRARSEFQSGVDDPDLSKDLTRILNMGEKIRQTPARFRAIFACSSKDIWQEFDLPVSGDVSALEISRRFHLVPLLRALESCTPYCVAIVEHGKTRVFIIRGYEIREIEGPFLSVDDLSLHADDSRVGWSRHIDANVDEHEKASLKKLAVDLHQLMQDAHFQHLVIGCREDLWSELAPQLANAGLAAIVAGHFHLPSFDLAPNSVMQSAKSVFDENQRQYYANFWESIIQEKPTQSAVGVEPVMQSLESGRVQTLFLGNISGTNVSECANCNKWWLKASNTCAFCGSSDVSVIPAEELLFRKALLTGAEILAPDAATSHLFGDVGAILRY